MPDLPETGDFEERDPDTNTVRMQVRLENGRAVGLWRRFRRDGSLAWEETRKDGLEDGKARGFHPDGSVSTEGELSAGRWEGPRRWFHDNGTVQTEGAYVHDARDGTWKWFDSEGSVKTIIRFVANARKGDERPHQRIEYLRSHANGNKKWERTDRDDGGWIVRTYYEDGSLESETPIEVFPSGGAILGYADGTFSRSGERHGKVRELHPNGEPKSEGMWEQGEPVGEHISWSEDGTKSVVQYECGTVLLPEAQLKKLATKMAKKRESYDMRSVLERAKIEWGEHSGVVWQMFRRGLLTANDGPIWELMEPKGGTAEDGARLVSQLPDSRKSLFDVWPSDLDAFVLELAQEDPEPFERALPELSRMAQRGVKLVLARLGRKVDRKDDRYSLGQLARQDIEGFTYTFPMIVDGVVHEHARIRDPDGRPTPQLFELVELFTTRPKWAAAVRKARAKQKYDRAARVDHFEGIEAREELCEWLGYLDAQRKGADAIAVLEARDDSLEDLQWIAESSEDPIVVAAVSVIAIERGATSWPEVDPRGLAKIPADRVAQALRRVPNDELAKRLASTGTVDAVAAICSLADAGKLWGTALKKVATEQPDLAKADALARMGSAGLPHLSDAIAAHPKSVTLRLGALKVLAALADSGTPWDPAFDNLLTGVATDDDALRSAADSALRLAAAALPRDRYRAVALRVVTDERDDWFLGLPALGSFPSGEALSQLFERLVHAPLTDPVKAAVSAALETVDERKYVYVRWALHNDPSPTFLAWLREAFAWSDDLEQDFEALAPDTPSDEAPAEPEPKEPDAIDELLAHLEGVDPSEQRTPIYAPRWIDERPPAGDPGHFNQVGGVPAGFTQETWPKIDPDDDDPEPMEFLFMVDLATIPELAAAYPDKRALAMFIDSADSNEAYNPDNEECLLIALDETELAQPRLEESPGIERTEQPYELYRIEVPVSAFGDSGELHDLVWRLPARFLGEPIWIQDAEHWGDLLLQFDESFVPMNLGDCGVMYVFDDAQFWQCS